MFFPGQHMLCTTEPFHALLSGIELSGRVVLEPCVGTGVITRLTLERGPQAVIGFEIDPDICQLVDPRLDLRIGDFRRATLPTLDPRHCLIAAPFYGLLDDLLPLVVGEHAPITDVILMVPETRLADFSGFEVAFVLGPEDFDPPPKTSCHYVIRRGFHWRPA